MERRWEKEGTGKEEKKEDKEMEQEEEEGNEKGGEEKKSHGLSKYSDLRSQDPGVR